jgi:hypothetical protein
MISKLKNIHTIFHSLHIYFPPNRFCPNRPGKIFKLIQSTKIEHITIILVHLDRPTTTFAMPQPTASIRPPHPDLQQRDHYLASGSEPDEELLDRRRLVPVAATLELAASTHIEMPWIRASLMGSSFSATDCASPDDRPPPPPPPVVCTSPRLSIAGCTSSRLAAKPPLGSLTSA